MGSDSMAVHSVLRMGDPRLLQPSRPAEAGDDVETLVRDLFETMRAAGGCGLAAPQIGVPLRVVVYGLDRAPEGSGRCSLPDTVLVNPVLLPLGTDQDCAWEGCLSIPGMSGLVPRHRRIRLQARDLGGRVIDRELTGFEARVVQHECDHLDGVLYPLRITNLQQFGFVDELRDHGRLAPLPQPCDAQPAGSTRL